MMTLGVLQAFEEMGLHYPDDLGLATFDDIAGDHSFHPRLTVVAQPTYEMGAQGATLLMDRIDGKLKGKPVVIRLKPTLIVRGSTKTRASAAATPLRPTAS
jgi:LacI family transcriptional regulator